MYSFEKKAHFNKTKYDVSDTVFLTVTKLLCCMMLMESLTFEHVAKIIQVVSVLQIPYWILTFHQYKTISNTASDSLVFSFFLLQHKL